MDPYNQPTVAPLVDLGQQHYYPEQQQDLYPPLQQTPYPPQQQPPYPAQQQTPYPPQQVPYPIQQQTPYPPQLQTPYPQQQVLLQQSPPPAQAYPLPQNPAAMEQAPPPQQVAIQSSSATVYTQQQALTSPFNPRDTGCRVPARVIAFLDIAVSILSCILLVLFIIACVFVIREAKSKEHSYPHYDGYHDYNPDYPAHVTVNYAFVIVFICVSVIGIITLLIEIYIAWQLVSATELGASPTYAIDKARCWRNYNIFLLILTLVTVSVNLGGSSYTSGSSSLLFFVVRLVCVYIVHRFIQGLQYSMVMTATPVTVVAAMNQAQPVVPPS